MINNNIGIIVSLNPPDSGYLVKPARYGHNHKPQPPMALSMSAAVDDLGSRGFRSVGERVGQVVLDNIYSDDVEPVVSDEGEKGGCLSGRKRLWREAQNGQLMRVVGLAGVSGESL